MKLLQTLAIFLLLNLAFQHSASRDETMDGEDEDDLLISMNSRSDASRDLARIINQYVLRSNTRLFRINYQTDESRPDDNPFR
ncbi:MAG: hypothetical protein MHMPM18_000135 [Marteilia pararefringens]